jgi:hypothetical protein
MKLIGYIDGKKSFVRDEVTQRDAEFIVLRINELTNAMRKRLVLFVEHEGITHMIRRAP